MLRDNIILLMMLNMIDYNLKQLDGSFNTFSKPTPLELQESLLRAQSTDRAMRSKTFVGVAPESLRHCAGAPCLQSGMIRIAK